MKNKSIAFSFLTLFVLTVSTLASASMGGYEVIHCKGESGFGTAELSVDQVKSYLYGFSYGASRYGGCGVHLTFGDSGYLTSNHDDSDHVIGYSDDEVTIKIEQDGSVSYANTKLGYQARFDHAQCSIPESSSTAVQ